MTLNFAAPLFLLLLLPVLAGGIPAARRRAPALLPFLLTLACVLLAFALARPAITFSHQPRAIVIILDPASTTRGMPWHIPAYVRQLAAQHLPPSAQLTILRASPADQITLPHTPARPEILLLNASPSNPAGWPDRWPPANEKTDLAGALAWRARPTDHRPRWLLTDGLRPIPQVSSLQAITIHPSIRMDAGISNITAHSAENNAVQIRVTLRATGPAHGTLIIRRNGVTINTQAWSLPAAGARSFSARDAANSPVNLSGQPVIYSAELTPHDLWPEDDRAQIFGPVLIQPRLLIATADRPALPTDSAELARYQVIELRGVPAAALPQVTQTALVTAVREAGVGLLITGTQRAFGPGGYAQAPLLNQLSPLAAAPPNPSPRQIIFLLDASGSMAQPAGPRTRIAAATEAITAACRLLRPDDQVVVITFGRTPHLLSSGPAEALDLPQKLAGIQPDGPTAPDQALPLLMRNLQENGHVILLTDGQVPHITTNRWQAALAARHATLTIIAPPGPSLAALQAATGARQLAAADPADWRRLLRDATTRADVGRYHATPLAWRADVLTGTASAWTETWLRPGAQEICAGAGGQPLAATAQRGLGRVAALAMADTSPDAAKLYEQLLRAVTAGPGDQRYRITLDRQAAGWLIQVDAHDSARFINGADLAAELLRPGQPPQRTPLEQVGPGLYETMLQGGGGFGSEMGTLLVTEREAAGGPRLVGRVAVPAVGGPKSPALAVRYEAPSGVTQLPAGTTTRWLQIEHWDATTFCLLAAGAVLAAALAARVWPRRMLS